MHNAIQVIPTARADELAFSGDAHLMNSATDFVGGPRRAPTSPQPLASWYTHGVSDGLGDRLLMFDNTATASLELLRFRSDFAGAPGFEDALRERVERLAAFKHPAFAYARAVERLDDDEGLALISIHTPGKRLSEVFHGSQARTGLHPALVVWLIRELTAALADLHAQGAGIAHGALVADRIVLTPDGRLVIVEHVLGSALDESHLSARQLWHDLGILALPGANGAPRLDVRGDVVQLGLVALSVLLGRRVTSEEYPERLELLLDESSERAEQRSPSIAPALRLWLARALQVHDGGFGSALEARDGLRELPESVGARAFEQFHASHLPAMRSLPETSMKDRPVPTFMKPVPAVEPPTNPPWTVPEAVIVNNDAPAAWVMEEAVPGNAPRIASTIAPKTASAMVPVVSPNALRPVAESPAVAATPTLGLRAFLTTRNLAVACGAVAVLEAVAIGGLLMTRTSAPAPAANVRPPAASIPVTIESPGSGDIVMVDGRQAGVTPLMLTVSPLMRSIRVLSSQPPVASTPAVAPPVRVAEARPKTDAGPPSAAPAQSLAGGLRLTSPIELQVLEGERVLGSSATGPIVISAGQHQLDFINSALGYRSRQTVQIKAGQVLPLRVQPPDGRVSINALPWAQVWIDGNPVGETPLANLPVAVGEHEIIFRHPQLGERRETAVVKSDTLTRVSATLGR